MTIQQALNIIDQVSALAPVNRQVHVECQAAIKLLADALADKKE